MFNKWDITFIKVARLISEHSTCIRKKVGCVITIENRIVSIGYNGVLSGEKHCNVIFKNKINDKDFYEKHHSFSKNNEIHAEQNCISYAVRNGINLFYSTLYVTTSPCIDCAKLIIASGIKQVMYEDIYDRDKRGLLFLKKHIHIKQIKGTII